MKPTRRTVTLETLNNALATYEDYARFKTSLDPLVAVQLAYRLDCTKGRMHFKAGWNAARFRNECMTRGGTAADRAEADTKLDQDELPRPNASGVAFYISLEDRLSPPAKSAAGSLHDLDEQAKQSGSLPTLDEKLMKRA